MPKEAFYAPYHVIDTPGFNVDVRGVCGEMLKAIASSLRTNYTIAFPPDSYWGLRKADGNWTGVLGMLQRDEADLAASVINPTSEKRDVAVETETILPIELMILAGRLSKHQSNIFGIIQVLTWEVWLLFGCSMVLSALLWSFSDWVHWGVGGVSTRRSTFVQAFGNHLWSFVESSCLEGKIRRTEIFFPCTFRIGAHLIDFRCLVRIPSTSTPTRFSARVVVGTFWLLVIVVTTVVAGQMKAMMMVREEADRIDSMRHLAARPAMKPYTIAGSAGVSSVRDSKDPDYQKVWRMMQTHKTDLPTSVALSDQTLLEVVAGKAVLIMSRASVAARATAACASFERGEFYLAREPMFKFNSVFYLNNRLAAARKQAINNRILWLRESGLVAKWWQESSGNWEGCGQVISDGRLKFSEFQDLLLFWLAMLGIATAVFLCESACAVPCSGTADIDRSERGLAGEKTYRDEAEKVALGSQIFVPVKLYAPYHVISEEGFNVPVKGVCGEILAAITRSLRTNYTITFPLDSFWGLLKPDGNWTGVLGMLQRDEADLALSVINPTSEKKDVAVESETILPIEIMILAGRQSRHESNILGIIQIFPWEVWLLTFCCFVMSAIMWYISDYVHFRLNAQDGSFDHAGNFFGRLWVFVENTLLEASPEVPSRVSARILVGGYWVVVIVLTTAFAGQMKAMLMVRQETNRIDSLRDLSERPTMKPYAPAGSAVISSIRRMPAPLMKFINRRILWLRDSGLVEKWWRESSGNWEGCGQATSDGTLTFADFSDLIKLLMAMLACAFAVCLLEMAAGRGLRCTPRLRRWKTEI
ncbi:hypothetical protein HPB51_018790 [Rhipicephalus microplus]|uniref:Ionotropic glutamate receptor L-glutamate and glycine-binding domain-containing protein n=1 Tax=Rhipicephalus microplus TaxID=6941 RepID=A0A9J6DI95_RHIMP|nr:hypothetical protein HPB51_018790 [Rhipicephalus microplus]